MKKIIGIVGGVGPYAGLDLNIKIFDNTATYGKDQDHLEVYLLSRSAHIGDRSEFLFNPNLPNPAEGIFKTIMKLANIGAEVVGIPCNTAHSEKIFTVIQQKIAQTNLSIQLVHMIEETHDFLQKHYPDFRRVGLLATQGTYASQVYSEILERNKIYQVLVPSKIDQQTVHQAIYHSDYGIKAYSHPVTTRAIQELTRVSHNLIEAGAQVIIMGCTEIPLALESQTFAVPLIDPTTILARALVYRAAPQQLLNPQL